MDTRKIQAFLAIARYKSFSKVARDLSYTPSALSHMADSLEQELGLKLFDRTRRGVELTPAGKELHDKFAAFQFAENALLEAAAQLAKGQQENLRIGTYSSVALHILPEILRGFKMEYPAVRTSLLVEDDIWRRLKEDALDVIFTDEYNRDKTAHWYPIMEDAYVVAVPEQEFPGKTVIHTEQLYDSTVIRLEEEALEEYLCYDRFKEVIPVQSIENETAISMVKGNIGIAVLPGLALKNCPAGVRVLELQPRLSRTIGIQYKTGKITKVTQKFIEHLKNSVDYGESHCAVAQPGF